MEAHIIKHRAYWSQNTPDLIRELSTSADGLTSRQAARRLTSHGANTVVAPTRHSGIRVFLRQFQSPLVLILIFGAMISMVVREWVDASIILAIVLGSTVLGFIQEYRASAAIENLRRRLALTTKTIRDGSIKTLAVSSIVPGDIILLSAGNLVPADGIVLEARDFLVTEASLTGESFPVEKQAGILPADTPISKRSNSVFLGSSVRSGTAKVLVVETGRATAMGAIAASLNETLPETEFARGIRQFGYLLVRVMLFMVIFVLAVNHLLDRPALESLLFAMALAVGITPELLPAIVSVTLSHGARAMARRGVIMRRLEAIENLGNMDVLCTDKTGTLTQGVITLDATTDPDGLPSHDVRQLAYLNSALESGIENPLDAAIVTSGQQSQLTTDGYRKIDEIPYDFIRKRLMIAVEETASPALHLMVSKGAFTSILGVCSSVIRDGKEAPLDEPARASLNAYFQRKSEEGYRVLAVAIRRVPARQHYAHEDERDMSFAGFLLFFDPPKPEAAKAIHDLATLGIRIKIVTGDNRYVAAHVARSLGLDAEAMLTGEQIANMKDESFWHLADRTDLFVEVDPQQKERIVHALQRTGHAVGYLGDGINDAPALHAADIGISVDQAVDVARESADVVLLRPDLDVLRIGVEDGRQTFANTLKYLNITTSANFGNMVSMALATPLLPFLPLSAKQILLNNLLSDIPCIAISTDRVDREKIVRAQRWQLRNVQKFMIVFGLISTVFDLLTFFVLLKGFHAGETAFQTAWFVVSLLTELAVVLVLRTEGLALRSRPSRALLWSSLAIAGFAICIPYIAPLASAFGFLPIPGFPLGTLLLIVGGYVLATEAIKIRFFKANP